MPNNFSAFNPEVWSKLVIERLTATNVAMAVAANTDYQGDIQQAGSTVHVRTYGAVSIQPYTKGSTINYESLAPATEPMIVNDAQSFAFQVDDLDNAQSDLPIEAGYSAQAAIAVGQLIDTKIFSYHTKAGLSVGSKNSPKTLARANTNSLNVYSLLVEAGKLLDKANAPSAGRWIILGPDAKAFALLDDDLIKSFTRMADTIIGSARAGMTGSTAPNFLGQIGEFDIYWSNNLPKFGTTTANLFGQGKPISYASKFQQTERIRLESTFAWAVRGLILHDGEVFAEHAKRLGVLWTN